MQVIAACPCGEPLWPRVVGLYARFRCRRHPDRLAIFAWDGQVQGVGRELACLTAPRGGGFIRPGWRPPVKADHGRPPRTVGICGVCRRRCRRRDGGYRVEFWCPRHPRAPVVLVHIPRTEHGQPSVWTGKGWDRMRGHDRAAPVLVGRV